MAQPPGDELPEGLSGGRQRRWLLKFYEGASAQFAALGERGAPEQEQEREIVYVYIPVPPVQNFSLLAGVVYEPGRWASEASCEHGAVSRSMPYVPRTGQCDSSVNTQYVI